MSIKEFFTKALSESQILTNPSDLAYFGKDVCQQYPSSACAILLPTTPQEVHECIKIAYENKIALVPSGGRTGYSAGATATNGEVVLSLTKLNKIIDLNETERTITVQAGVPLEEVQNYAKARGFMYPIDFTSRGSCLIGGTIATNAGGIRVIRYGLTRDWVLGLKVITGKAEILELNRSLVKNQSGYDLRQVFIGSEGTLGIVVEATLKLTSPANETKLAFCAFHKLEDVLPTLTRLRAAGLTVDLFEFLDEASHKMVLQHNPTLRSPFETIYPCYAVIEIDNSTPSAQEKFEQVLSNLIEENIIADVAISESSQQYQDLMALREMIGESANQHYTVHKNDISVSISDIPQFITELKDVLKIQSAAHQVIIFGHMGDGNLHVNILMSKDLNQEKFWNDCEKLDHQIFGLVQKFRGSISAEHGVGLLKKDFLHYSRTPQEIELMRGMKKVFDPANILNPGKIF